MSNEHDAPSPAPRPEPVPLVAAEPGSEPCPNCGKPLGSPNDVLCVHCGYDLTAVVQRATVVGRPVLVEPGTLEKNHPGPSAASGESASKSAAGEVTSGRTAGVLVPQREVKLPSLTAAACALALLVGHLAGLGGLYPRVDGLFRAADGSFTSGIVLWPERLLETGRFAVRTGLTWGAALLAIAFIAQLRAVRVGDFTTYATRVLAIVLAASLFRLIQLPDRWLEMSLELLLQCAVFVGLVSLWLRLSFAEAGQALAGTAILMLVLHGAALAVVWAG